MFKMNNIVQCIRGIKENLKRAHSSAAGNHKSENGKYCVFCPLYRIVDAHSPLTPYAFPAQLTLIPRSFETFSRELRRISETSGKVIYSCLILIWYIVKSYFYSNRSRWGEIPCFTGKSPPRISIF